MEKTRKKDNSKIDKIPTSKIARSRVVGLTTLKIGARKLGLMAKRPFLSKHTYGEQQRVTDQLVGETLYAGLAHLRGTALKIAQLLSLESGILPESLRNELYKSHYRAPSLNRATVRRTIKAELGKYPEEIFSEFDDQAFAAASLGQVHHATDRDGRKLAVKVQYPGIATAVQSDLEIVRRLFAPFLGTRYLNGSLSEIEIRLQEEVNYELERDNTNWFRCNLISNEVVIPEVINNLSTSRILTTTFQEGLHILPWLESNPSQRERNHLAQSLFDFFMVSSFEHHRFHADPNPGNYLFRNDQRLVVIDFGCVKKFTSKGISNFKQVLLSHYHDDFEAVKHSYRTLGVKNIESGEFRRFYKEKLRPFGEWVAAPFRAGEFDFSVHKSYCDELGPILHNTIFDRQLDGLSTEGVMLDRNFYGLYRTFQEMGAKVHFDVGLLKE